jgi:hypothetical protein
MLAMPGCWAREEMGAALAGVFCGVLECQRAWEAKGEQTYGALRSTGWFRAAMVARRWNWWKETGEKGAKAVEMQQAGLEVFLADVTGEWAESSVVEEERWGIVRVRWWLAGARAGARARAGATGR